MSRSSCLVKPRFAHAQLALCLEKPTTKSRRAVVLRLVSRRSTRSTLRLTTTDVGLMPGLNVAWWLSGRALDLRLTGHGSIPSQSAFTLHMSTQPCIPPGSLNRVLYLLRLGVKAGFSPVWWQVTLCDHIRYVSFP